MAEVALQGVVKRYGTTPVIHGIDLAIRSGEFVVFVGPSGCGKSTLLRMIAGLEEITSGQISIGGNVVNELPPRSRDIAMVFQDYALYPHKTVFENMAFGLRLRKRPEPEIRERVGEAANILQINHLLERKPRELSGGQRQRVAMGRAIVRQPKAFLFDEPLSNLDALLRSEMRVEIKKLHQALGNTIIYVTHDQVEAMTLADRIVVLQAGNLIQYDTPDGIYNRPAAKFVAGFTGSPPMNFLPARVGEGGRAIHLGGGVDLPVPQRRVAGAASHAGREVTFGLRPEHITTGRINEPHVFTLDGQVMLVEPLGSDTLALIRIGNGSGGGEMTGRFAPDAGLRVGQTLPVALALDHFHLFDSNTGAAIRGADWQ
ncbi:MAG TPA: sn-glycerol-3-phosphate ABC transporter ATP-binding protein UgpC [Casimicrobiaceae bacterium]|nr:sn-glycerol-3-phosphate ABC transporter ATP-binding protein UgpC [Casimicrobiaceae bacterium]